MKQINTEFSFAYNAGVTPMEQLEIYVKSSVDETMQPSLFYGSHSEEKRPLLVGLHTWSHDRFNQVENMLPYAQQYNFNLLLPNFRGANTVDNPDCTFACGSLHAKQDIKDAIDYVTATENIDADNIFLLGASGGGHMAMLMAGFCPEYFKAIGAFVPIMDVKKWSEENLNYTAHINACTGGDDAEMVKRSPISYMDIIAKSNTKIFHGKHDPSVPFTQSRDFYIELLKKYPDASVYLDIFDGGHEMDMKIAMYWIMSQYKKEKKADVTG